MSFETRKAMKRRMAEDEAGVYPWQQWFDGSGIDVGCGPDKVPLTTFIGFDQKDGDANKLSTYFPAESFDVVHGSHVLEHMHNPGAALRDWFKLLKPGGRMIQTVPDVGAYERFTYPSKYNPDHKSSWSMIYRGSPFPIHCHIPTFLAELSDVADIALMRYVEENYNWSLPPNVDQTWEPEKGTEIWNEWVLIKR